MTHPVPVELQVRGALPGAPQSLCPGLQTIVAHAPFAHPNPALQVLPAQHAPPDEPHDLHVPLVSCVVHTRPEKQDPPAQQLFPTTPQVVHAFPVAVADDGLQVRPELHASLSQHAAPLLPQSMHLPELQLNPS